MAGIAMNEANAYKIAIDIAGVSMAYPGASSVKALDNVNFSIGENEFFTLLGPSGCGKTTLLRLIAGFEQPSEGVLWLDGLSLAGKLPHQRPVNTVFQSYALFPHMTVAQNIAFALEMQGRPAASVQPIVEQMLALVRLDGLGARRPSQLSGGQQQRVALARALASRPRVLLLDESLSALDLQLRREMQIELKRLQRETGITFVFVTHDQEEALTMSDRIAVMHAGEVQQIGTPAEIYDRPANRFVAGFIGETNLLSVRITAGQIVCAGAGPAMGNCLVPDTSWLEGDATLAVRPERMELLAFQNHAEAGLGSGSTLALRGTVSRAVYMGHDTVYTVVIEGQLPCHIRLQNTHGAQQSFVQGSDVAVRMPAASLRRLSD